MQLQICNRCVYNEFLWCVCVFRGRDLKKQHEQRVYEREMQRITLPLSAFSNPTCELVDENTIVITADPETTPVQERVEGADPLMGQQAGTPGAWVGLWSSNGTVIHSYGPKHSHHCLSSLPPWVTSVLKGVGEQRELQRLNPVTF